MFPSSLARDLLDVDVKRFEIDDFLPNDATAEDRARAEAAAAKSCAYMPEDADSPEDRTVALQLDQGLFSSKDDFIEANDHSGARPVSNLGVAAFISPIEDRGQAIAVLLDDTNSFALVTPDEVPERQAISAARQIAERFSG